MSRIRIAQAERTVPESTVVIEELPEELEDRRTDGDENDSDDRRTPGTDGDENDNSDDRRTPGTDGDENDSDDEYVIVQGNVILEGTVHEC